MIGFGEEYDWHTWLLFVFALIGLITSLLILVNLLFKQNNKSKLIKWFVGNDLIKSTTVFFEDVSNKNINSDSSGNFVAQIILRLTRFWWLPLIISIIPTLLLILQYSQLKIQNQLIQNQNDKIEIQSNLLEADRRSSLVFLFSNVVDAIDRELKQNNLNAELQRNSDFKGLISQQSIGRIIALSQSLKPYRYYDDSSLVSKPISPERGQLIIQLLNSGIKIEILNEIWSKGNFQYSDLAFANLRDAYLVGIDLSYSDLTGTDFTNGILNNTQFKGAVIKETIFDNADLSGSKFHTKILKGSFKRVKFKLADLNYANFKACNFYETDFYLAKLNSAALNYCNLEGSNFSSGFFMTTDSVNSTSVWDSTKTNGLVYKCGNCTQLLMKNDSIISLNLDSIFVENESDLISNEYILSKMNISNFDKRSKLLTKKLIAFHSDNDK